MRCFGWIGQGSRSDLGKLLELVRRRTLTVGLSVLACVTAAAAYILLSAPVYRATAELLISPQSLQIVGRDIVRTDVASSLEMAQVDSQASVILSTTVLRQVYEELGLAGYPEFQPRTGLLAWLLNGDPLSESQRETVGIELLKKSLVVSRLDNTLVFRITVSSPDPGRAAQIANALVAAFLRETSQGRVETVERANASLVGQVAGLRDQLNAAEIKVERFRSENGLIRSSETGLVVTQQLNGVYTQIDAAAAEVARLAAHKEQMAKIRPEALLTDTVPDVLNSSTLVGLRAQYAQINREVASQARTLLPQHPRLLELQAELGAGRRQIQAELTRLRASVAESHAQAVGNLEKLRAQAKEIIRQKVVSGEAETRLRQLESEAEAIRSVLNASLNRARELDQQRGIEPGTSRMLSKAAPPVRSSNPSPLIVLAAAALFGLCAGVGIAYATDTPPDGDGGSRMSARDAGRLLGVDTVVAVPAPGGFRHGPPTPTLPAALLEPLALALAAHLRHHRSALVGVAAAHGTGRVSGPARGIAEALAGLGAEVILYDEAAADAKVTRLPGRAAASGGRIAGLRNATSEFVVATSDLSRTPPVRPATPAGDAVVLVVDLERTDPPSLLAAARAADPSGRRIFALLALNAPPASAGRADDGAFAWGKAA